MKRAILVLTVLVAFDAAAATAPKPVLTTVMYLINKPSSIASFQENWRQISIIAPQSFIMDAEGFIEGEVPPAALSIAREHGVAVMPLVTNRGFDQPLMHTVLDTQASRARAIRYLLFYALRDGYIGFQFDYENIKYTYRDRFTEFFREAAREFHRHGLLLSAAVVGKYSDERTPETAGGYDDWSGVYDYRLLAKAADFISVMAYPQHGVFSEPGPVAGYSWVEKIVSYSTGNVSARKISLGVPLYGFQWITAPSNQPAEATFQQDNAKIQPAQRGHSLGFDGVSLLLARLQPDWDEAERSSHLRFADDEGQHEVWYEDARSLAPKLQLVTGNKLTGISGWALGQEDPAIWQGLARDYRVRRPRVVPLRGSQEQRARAAARALAH